MRLGRAIAISVALGGFAPAAAARGTCAIESKKGPPLLLQVAPKEAAPFTVPVDGVAVAVEPGGLETPATVRVKAALAFEGHMANEAIPARTKRAVDDLSGMVHLAPAREHLTLHANVRAKIVDAAVRLTGVELRGLMLPCDALTLDDVAAPKLTLEDDGSARFVPKHDKLQFRSGPGKGATIEVAVEDPGALELKRVEDQAGWARVTTRWPDGTTLHGWVKADELAPAGMHHERISDAQSLPQAITADCGPPRVGANEKVAAATVAAGTQVYAARYLGAWAKVVDGSKLQVRFRPKDDWVEIVSGPGFPCALGDAWIQRSAAKLPPDTSPSDTQ